MAILQRGELQWRINGARQYVAHSIMTDRMQQSVSIHEEISDICKKRREELNVTYLRETS